MPEFVNISRGTSGGVFNGLFGNPKREATVSEQYRIYIRNVLQDHPFERAWLKTKLAEGALLYCAGCGVESPTCHGQILREELNNCKD